MRAPGALLWLLLPLLPLRGGGHDGRWINQIAGPFRIIPDHFEKCPPEQQPARTYYRHRYSGWRDRHNPDQWYYSWNGTSFFTVNDELTRVSLFLAGQVDVNIASWSSRGGWKDNAHRITIPGLCSAFHTCSPSLWRKVMKAMFDDPSADCPFPPGSYSFANMTTNFDMKVPPSFFYGKWRATGRLLRTRSKELIGCARAYGWTVPKLGPRRPGQPQRDAEDHNKRPSRIQSPD